MDQKIFVTGATGHLGKLVVSELLDKISAENITVLVRDLSKAEGLKAKGVSLVQGDYTDFESLVSAFRGADKLYFISGSDVAHRTAQHENVVKAASEAKVGHIYYTSFQRKTDDGSSPIAPVSDAHLKTERLIKESGLTYTILKHALYMDILPLFMGDQILERGTIFLPAGEGNVSFATRKDLASGGVALLTSPGHENKTYELAGEFSFSFNDIANILTELSGKTIQYISPSAEDFTEQLAKAGVHSQAIQGVTTFCEAIARGEFDFPGDTLSGLIGRKTVDIADFLKEAYKL